MLPDQLQQAEGLMSSESSWRIEIKPSAVKALRRLPRHERDRLIAAIDRLPQGDVRPLKGSDEYRLRVGAWRVRFIADPAARVVTVLVVKSRGQVYKPR